jgi:hypothetical protein
LAVINNNKDGVMLRSKQKVLEKLNEVRENVDDYYMPLSRIASGRLDRSTEAKKDISNLARTLYNRIPLIQHFTDAAKNYPVYVGYDGQEGTGLLGSYFNNIINMSHDADESSIVFIRSFAHELTHMDQDRRNLERTSEVPPPPEDIVGFLVHNVCLEAAAVASEATCLYYFSQDPRIEHRKRKTLAGKFPEVKDYFHDFLADELSHHIGVNIIAVAQDRNIHDKKVFKEVWKAAFQAFFAPDSKYMESYMKRFCEDFLERSEHTFSNKSVVSTKSWGGTQEIKAITSLPGFGTMFGDEAAEIIAHLISDSVTQDKFRDMIDITRSQVEKMRIKNTASIVSNIFGNSDNSPSW